MKTKLFILSLLIMVINVKAQFSGDFAPSNWNYSSTTPFGDGYIDTSNAPINITLFGSNGTIGTNEFFDLNPISNLQYYEAYTTVIKKDVVLNVGYSHFTDDIPSYDVFLYSINGVVTQVETGNGILELELSSNDTLAFLIHNKDNCCGRGQVTLNIISITETSNCPEDIEYCQSKASYDGFMWNNATSIGDLAHTTGKSGGYADYKNEEPKEITTTENGTINLSLTPGFYYWAYNMGWRVFVDWNQNGDFGDTGEMMYSGVGNTTKTGTFNVPAGTNAGCYAVRVSTAWGAYPNACGNFGYGEVEDYMLNVEAGNGNPLPRIAQPTEINEPPFNYNFEFATNQSIVRSGKDINVTLLARNNGNTNFNISDALGRVYRSVNINHEQGETVTTISTSALPTGMYFISNSETVQALKVIVQ